MSAESIKCINVALIGCGGFAENYRHIYTEIPEAKLVLLVDESEETARRASEACGGVAWSTDFNDCLSSDVHFVDISTPNFLHREQACAALKAGKHVLLQKPLASSLEDALKIAEIASSSGKIAGMYMFLFDNPLFHDIKKLIKEGKLGTISGVGCRSAHRGGLSAVRGGWRSSAKMTGGGSFIQLAIHYVNMVQWLMDSKVESVMAYSHNLMCPNIGGDDVSVVACEFDSGALGTISSAYCAQGDELSIFGSKGYLRVDDSKHITLCLDEPFCGNVLTYNTGGRRETISLPQCSMTLFDSTNPFDQHVAFIKSLLSGSPAPVPIDIGLYDMMIVDAVHRSSVTGKKERVVQEH